MTIKYLTYLHPLIDNRLQELKAEVKKLKASQPDKYKQHRTTKLLAKAVNSIKIEVPKDPSDDKYRLGNTIKPYKHWRRVKKGLPDRFRLFFRYSDAPAVIVHAWLNDERTLRKAGSKTDVYTVFKAKLEKGDVPDSVDELVEAAKAHQAKKAKKP